MGLVLNYAIGGELGTYKVRQIIDMLKEDGWKVVRTRGDHRQFKNTKGKRGTVTVSGKPSDTLSLHDLAVASALPARRVRVTKR